MALAAALAGCAHVAPEQGRELLEARAAVRRADASPAARYAPVELREADDALLAAEREEARAPGSVSALEGAYAALRLSDRARLQGLYTCALEALEDARRRADALRVSIERTRVEKAERAKREDEERRRREARLEAQSRALEDARLVLDPVEIERGPRGIVLRLPAGALFIRGYPLLRNQAPPRVEALAAALSSGPPSDLFIDLADDVGAPGVAPFTLAQRRADRLREALAALGVDPESVTLRPHRGPTATLTITIVERARASSAAHPGVPRP